MALLTARAPAASAPAPDDAPPATLLAALRAGASITQRRQAALGLARLPDMASALAARLREETSPPVQEAIVTALVMQGNEAAAEGLAGYLASEDPQLRNLAIEALREIGAAAAAPVERLLSSVDPDIRIFAVSLLETLPPPLGADLLRAVLRQEPEVNVGLAAVEALSQIGGPEDLEALRAFAARFADHPFAAFAVDLVCRRMASGGER